MFKGLYELLKGKIIIDQTNAKSDSAKLQETIL